MIVYLSFLKLEPKAKYQVVFIASDMLASLSLIICLTFMWLLVKFLHKVWWTPTRIQRIMRTQGIKGPSYTFPHGNTKEISQLRSETMGKPMDTISHDISSRIQPHVYTWKNIYGMNFLTWHGTQAQLFVTDPELIKQVLMNKEGAYPKMDVEGYAKKLLGEAIITNEGEKWAKVRKLANHTFHAESLKSMVPKMTASVEVMLERWKLQGGKEMDVFKEFGLLTTDVISKTAFGSSYREGKHIFEMVAKLTAVTVRNVYNVRFPGISKLRKTKDEIEAEKLEKGIKTSILELVKKREIVNHVHEKSDSFGTDYLGQLMKITYEADEHKRIPLDQMIDEIKAFYGAGHLTTTSLLGWCVFLLATHKEWQEKARQEVLETFNHKNPTSDGISRLKTMNMIINECLRLYSPVITLARKVQREVTLGNVRLPANINIFIPVLSVHHDSNIWGRDAHIFKPERFAQGVTKATNNNAAAFLPFGSGPRTCVGLNFTTNEAKIVLSMILQRYKISLSPSYVHYPADIFILTPKNGVVVILEELQK
ncbi:oxygenase [Lithospermum erythrorhizon]|uniref:Oxygenase n=1 Tax=Lithospermum erythrorhizon TaxID=34254 RepID=A0AAV3QWM5_LITER